MARRLGITAGRIIFARWAPTSAAHVQRTALASLSLDTPLYNSMTTGCDVLWSGVPLVSLSGEKMVSRMGASLLLALGVPSLVVRTSEEYEELGAIISRAAAEAAAARELRAAQAKEAAASAARRRAEAEAAAAKERLKGQGSRRKRKGEKVAAVSTASDDAVDASFKEAQLVMTRRQRRVAKVMGALRQARTASSLYDMKAKADELVTALKLAWDLYSIPTKARFHALPEKFACTPSCSVLVRFITCCVLNVCSRVRMRGMTCALTRNKHLHKHRGLCVLCGVIICVCARMRRERLLPFTCTRDVLPVMMSVCLSVCVWCMPDTWAARTPEQRALGQESRHHAIAATACQCREGC